MALTLQTWAADAPAGPPVTVTDLAFSNHLAALRQSAPPGFSIVTARPFIVLGDEPADIVQMRAEKTVKWAVDMLKQDYFTRDPDEQIDVWLFKDEPVIAPTPCGSLAIRPPCRLVTIRRGTTRW